MFVCNDDADEGVECYSDDDADVGEVGGRIRSRSDDDAEGVDCYSDAEGVECYSDAEGVECYSDDAGGGGVEGRSHSHSDDAGEGGVEGRSHSHSDDAGGVEGRSHSHSDDAGGVEGRSHSRRHSDDAGGVEGRSRSRSDSDDAGEGGVEGGSRSHSDDAGEGGVGGIGKEGGGNCDGESESDLDNVLPTIPSTSNKRKKRGRQLDLSTQVSNVEMMVGKISFHYFNCIMLLARNLVELVGMRVVLSLLITSMALPADVLAIVAVVLSSTALSQNSSELIAVVDGLTNLIDMENDGIYSEDSIYGFFVRVIITFITMIARQPSWFWTRPGAAAAAADGGDDVVYTSMSVDKKSLIDVIENVSRHKKVKIVVCDTTDPETDINDNILSSTTVARLRKVSNGFRVCTELEWYITATMMLMTEIAKRSGKFVALPLFVNKKTSSNPAILNVAQCRNDAEIKRAMYNLLNSVNYTDVDYHFATQIINLFSSDFSKCAW